VLDLQMLRKADQAIVVVGEEQAMDAALLNAFDNDGLSAQQALLPSNASPRLDTTKLPLVQLTDREFVNAVTRFPAPKHAPHQKHANSHFAPNFNN